MNEAQTRMNPCRDSTSQDIRLILLFGMPRSGTTWLGKVFDSHPQTLYRHEPDSGGALDKMLPLFPELALAERYRDAIHSFVAALPHDRSLRASGKLPLFPKDYQSAPGHVIHKWLILISKIISRWRWTLEVPGLIRSDYSGPFYLAWKSIESLGRLGVITYLLPACRTIHIIRHPCGFVASVLGGEARGLLPGAVPASEDYGILELLMQTPQAQRRGLTVEHLRTLQPEERLAWRWLLYNEKALEDLQTADNARTVRYEDLCHDPAGGYRVLFEFAGLSWESQTAHFVDASTHKEQSAYFSVFKDPERAASGWRRKLSLEQQQRILAVVADSQPGALYAI